MIFDTVRYMSIRKSEPPADVHPERTENRVDLWKKTFSDNWIGYSASILLAAIAIAVVGVTTGTSIVLVSVSLPLLAATIAIHLHLTTQTGIAVSALLDAEERLAGEASASRILSGIKVLRGSDSLSPDARLAAAARMATEYPVAVVFNLRDAHGVLAPSNWSYDGQLSQIRDEFEPVDSNEPGAIAARQGSAIVISNSDLGSHKLPGWAEQAGFSQGIVAPISRGLDTIGVVYALNKSTELPTLREIEQLELIVSFGSTGPPAIGRDSSVGGGQPFRIIEKSSSSDAQPSAFPIRMAGFALNPESERMEMDGTLISLSPTEFMLMHALASSPEKPVTPEELMDRCWSNDSRPADNAVDVAIFRLRKKLNKTASGKGLIKTVRGSGYMFIPPAVDAASPILAD